MDGLHLFASKLFTLNSDPFGSCICNREKKTENIFYSDIKRTKFFMREREREKEARRARVAGKNSFQITRKISI